MTLIASLLADMPDLRLRVQAQHVPDRHGFCADCRDGVRWPCEVSRIAADAERRGPGRRGTPGLPWSAPASGSAPALSAPYVPSPMSPAMSGPLPMVGALPGPSGGHGLRPASGSASHRLQGPAGDPLSAPMHQGRYV